MATLTISEEEFSEHRENYDGLCLGCETWTMGGVEPDARKRFCENCGKPRVYGAEEVLLMGRVDVEG